MAPDNVNATSQRKVNHSQRRLIKFLIFIVGFLAIACIPQVGRVARSQAEPSGSHSIYLPIISKPPRDNFMYGVLESVGFVPNPSAFEHYIQDWQSHGLDAALIINGAPDLSVSDRLNFKVVASEQYNLDRQWFYYEYYNNGSPLCGGNVTLDCARKIIGPIVDTVKYNPSLRGYYIFDDATPKYNERIQLATQVFQERDAVNPASPGLLPGLNGQTVFEYAQPQAFITYDYPAWNTRPACDFTEGQAKDWVGRLRETMQAKPMSVPYWAILQAHGGSTSSLRTPTVEEVRLLNWLALGEDAKGIFWLEWSGELFWTGIQDNPVLLAEITDLAHRVNRLRPVLSVIHKISDKFQIAPFSSAYVSTFKDISTGKLYVLAANHSCSAQALTLTSWFYRGQLKDLESGAIVNLGTPLSFRGGDGRLFEIINATPLTPPTPQPDLVLNPSFETTGSSGALDPWGSNAAATQDTSVAHTGSASLKISGQSATGITQWLTLKPDTAYYMSWYVKAQNLVSSRLSIQYIETNPSTIYLDDVQWYQNGSYDWVKRIGYFKTPPNYVEGKIILGWNLPAGSTFWVDDLTLCEADLPCADAYLAERDSSGGITGQ